MMCASLVINDTWDRGKGLWVALAGRAGRPRWLPNQLGSRGILSPAKLIEIP